MKVKRVWQSNFHNDDHFVLLLLNNAFQLSENTSTCDAITARYGNTTPVFLNSAENT